MIETCLNPYKLGLRFCDNAYRFGRPEDILDFRPSKLMILGSSMFWGSIILSVISPVAAAVSFVGCLVVGVAEFIDKSIYRLPNTVTNYFNDGINSRLEAELTKLIDATHNYLVQQTSKAILNVYEKHFEAIITKIDEKIKKLTCFSQHAGKLEQVIKEEKPHIGELYLDLLSEQFKITFPHCEIYKNHLLGKSNFPVFAAKLHMQNLNTVEAAAKQISLFKFNIQEVRYLTLLHHPNIIQFYGITKRRTQHVYYIIMDRMDCDAYTYFEQNPDKESDTQAIKMFSEITNASNYIHQKDLVHRDIKPANILVKMDATKVPSFYLADFGLVHHEPVTRCGTHGYFAPECIRKDLGPITHKSDVYSWGITIRQIINLVSSRAWNTLEFTKWKEASIKCTQHSPSDRPNMAQILEMVK
jgi:serine/threonine protein kinase